MSLNVFSELNYQLFFNKQNGNLFILFLRQLHFKLWFAVCCAFKTKQVLSVVKMREETKKSPLN